jgi:hypothetical protein
VNKLTCPAAETCTITDTVSVEVTSDNGDVDNYFSSAWQLDGAFTGEDGPFMGSSPSGESYTSGTWTDQTPGVGAGKHKVQSFVSSQDGANLYAWTVTYNLYD